MNNRRGLMFVVIGVVAAIAAGLVVYMLSLSVATANVPVVQTPEGTGTPIVDKSQYVDVVVAARDIEPKSVLTYSMMVTASMPSELVPTDAYKSMEEAKDNTAVARVSAKQVLVTSQFNDAGGRGGLSTLLAEGKVLVAFPSTDILNSLGAVQAGDHVDILLSIPISGTSRIDQGTGTGSQLEGSKTLVAQSTIQNVEVYGIGTISAAPAQAQGEAQGQAQPQNAGPKIITFIVDHQEALILKYIKDSGGTIDMVIRSIKEGKQAATDPVNIDYLVDLYKFIGLPTKK